MCSGKHTSSHFFINTARFSRVRTVWIFIDFTGRGDPSYVVGAGPSAAWAVLAAFSPDRVSGTSLGFGAHSPFFFGAGNLGVDTVTALPWAFHAEPANALSLPTWAIHFSSVFEWLFAMQLVWKYADVTGNEKWKGLTWGMLPLHASGLAACTYHFFYNP